MKNRTELLESLKEKLGADLLARIDERFPTPKGDKKDPYLVFIDGFPGMGKSTVARAISEREGSLILNSDEVRNFLGDYSKNDLKDLVQAYRLLKATAEGVSCINDSCFCHMLEEKLRFCREYGYPMYAVRLICPEDVIDERMAKRKLANGNFSVAVFADYIRMRDSHEIAPDRYINMEIDTSKELDPQIERFCEMIKKGNVVET